MKIRKDGFLSNELISHESEQFDYIAELHDYLWKFIRCELPAANGNLNDYLDIALENIQHRNLIKENKYIKKTIKDSFINKSESELLNDIAKLDNWTIDTCIRQGLDDINNCIKIPFREEILKFIPIDRKLHHVIIRGHGTHVDKLSIDGNQIVNKAISRYTVYNCYLNDDEIEKL